MTMDIHPSVALLYTDDGLRAVKALQQRRAQNALEPHALGAFAMATRGDRVRPCFRLEADVAEIALDLNWVEMLRAEEGSRFAFTLEGLKAVLGFTS